MTDHRTPKPEPKIPTDQVISSIRQIRDTLLTSLLSEATLLFFAEEHFGTIALSPIKIEFLKRDFTELRKHSLDLVFYATLIKESGSGVPIPSDHPLIIKEVHAIFKKYGLVPSN
ncbi:MAG: hypothetical protein ABL895_07840 [Cyclobacteriaceae bacterium]